MSLQPILVYWQPATPNPSKVLIILEELGLPYHAKKVDLHTERPQFEASVAVNGRLPAITDPNTGTTLWESAAIITYLVETYDKQQTISYGAGPEKYLQCQWQYFQASGQGPYFGQAAWFLMYHPEQVPSAQKRYQDEIKRIVGVLERQLSKSTWLVGDKCTCADLGFVTWNAMIPLMFSGNPGDWNVDDYPHYKRWHEALMARPTVQKAVSFKEEAEVQSAGRT